MEKKNSGVVNIVDECIMHRILFLLHSFFLRFSQCFCHVNGSTLYALLIQYNVCRLLLVYKTSFQIALLTARAKKNAKQRCKQCMICVWFAQLCTYLLMRKCIFMTWTGARDSYTAVSVRLSPFFFWFLSCMKLVWRRVPLRWFMQSFLCETRSHMITPFFGR